MTIQRYRQRISGPLLDRIDLHVEVPLVEFRDLATADGGETSATIRQRVEAARAHDRILKVARTLADLEAKENIDEVHLLEAINYRTLDRSLLG